VKLNACISCDLKNENFIVDIITPRIESHDTHNSLFVCSLYICMITGDNIGVLHNIEMKKKMCYLRNAKIKKKLNVPSIGFEFALLFSLIFFFFCFFCTRRRSSCNLFIQRIKLVMHACLSCATQIHFKAIEKFQKKLFFRFFLYFLHSQHRKD
jgi:hypothetical protein